MARTVTARDWVGCWAQDMPLGTDLAIRRVSCARWEFPVMDVEGHERTAARDCW